MPGKQSTAEPSWRPLAQKLSGLVNRRSSSKSKPLPDATDEKRSVFRLKRQRKGATDSTLEFKPLEVPELDALESIRLSEGWLETDTQNHDREQRLSVASDRSTTPIADLFASRSVAELPGSSQELYRVYPQSHGIQNTKRPFSMVENGGIAQARASPATPTTTAEFPRTSGSILDRGRPIEPRHFINEPPRVTKGLHQALPPESVAVAQPKAGSTEAPYPPEPPRLSVRESAMPKPKTGSQLLSVENAVAIKRHSMYEGATTPIVSAPVKTKLEPAPRSASATPIGRIQAWQKHITSAPNSAASSASPSGSAAVRSPATPLGRKLSTRAASDRLAWIRELEEKKSVSVNRDIGVLKKQAGSVSDKLAMFENKQSLAAPPTAARLPPLTRSNSTSRFSAAGMESIFSSNSNVTTASPRTSIDTVRSNNRASSIMSYYDDSFREKMESVVSGFVPDKDKPDVPEKQRVSTRFVPEEPEKPEEPVASESVKSEEPVASEEPEKPVASEKPEEPVASESVKLEEPVASESVKSEEPVASEEPEKPVASEKPEEPEKLEEPEKPKAPVTLEEPVASEELEKPEEPAALAQPVTSEEIVKPAEPVTSEELEKMQEPEKPEESVTLEEPLKPEEPVKSQEPVASEEPVKPEEPVTLEELEKPEQPLALEAPEKSEEDSTCQQEDAEISTSNEV